MDTDDTKALVCFGPCLIMRQSGCKTRGEEKRTVSRVRQAPRQMDRYRARVLVYLSHGWVGSHCTVVDNSLIRSPDN